MNRRIFHNILGLLTVFAALMLIACGGGGGSDESAKGDMSNNSLIGIGSVLLSWTPPTTNTDGTSLTDLAGYKIYYGYSEGNYTEVIEVDNPGIASFLVENLSSNTYYFVITAYDEASNESERSNVAVKSIF